MEWNVEPLDVETALGLPQPKLFVHSHRQGVTP